VPRLAVSTSTIPGQHRIRGKLAGHAS
jgi:hypothetical protein